MEMVAHVTGTDGRASLLLEGRDWAFALGAGLAFNLSALLLNYVLYRSRLIPRWLSAWGRIGAASWTAVWFPQTFGVEPGVLELVFLPIAVQEMVFGVYLIVRGFDQEAIADKAAVTDQPRSSPAGVTTLDGPGARIRRNSIVRRCSAASGGSVSSPGR